MKKLEKDVSSYGNFRFGEGLWKLFDGIKQHKHRAKKNKEEENCQKQLNGSSAIKLRFVNSCRMHRERRAPGRVVTM